MDVAKLPWPNRRLVSRGGDRYACVACSCQLDFVLSHCSNGTRFREREREFIRNDTPHRKSFVCVSCSGNFSSDDSETSVSSSRGAREEV